MYQKIIKFFSLFFFFVISANAQNGSDINSPFSTQGIGDLTRNMPVRNIGMGGVGISSSHADYINFMNPALLSARHGLLLDSAVKYTKWEAAISNQNRQFRTPEQSILAHSVNFHSFSYVLPIGNRWTSGFSLNQLSQFNANINLPEVQITDTLSYSIAERSNGGLFQASFYNAYNLTKNIALGLQTAYTFGRITEENIGTPTSPIYLSKYAIEKNSSYRGLMLKPGIAYRGTVNRRKPGDSLIYFNAGFTYEAFTGMTVDQTSSFQRRDLSGRIFSDSIVSAQQSSAIFPSSYRGGISFDKPGKWNIGMDVSYTNWSVFRTANSSDILSDRMGVAIGGEYYSPGAGERERKAITWRSGISYNKGYLRYMGTDLHDVSLSFGAAIPLGHRDAVDKTRPLSKLNIGLVMGQMSTFGGSGVRERYVNVYTSFLINDRWFRKRRIA
jgi:hypothetical protein